MTSSQTDSALVLQRVRYWIDWLSSDFNSGQWNSFFLGRGFEFQGITQYIDDPDLQRINWPATLISDELQVSQFSEEKNVNLYLLGNLSSSMIFGSNFRKLDRLAVLAAVIAFSAQKIKDNFQFVGYTDKVERGFVRIWDQNYPQILAKSILEFDSKNKADNGLYSASLSIQKHRSLIIIVSDFLGSLEETERALQILAPKHEVLPLIIRDQREITLPEKGWGFYPLRDLGTGELSYVFLTSRTRQKFADNCLRNEEALQSLFSRYGIEPHFLRGKDPDDDVKDLTRILLSKRNYA